MLLQLALATAIALPVLAQTVTGTLEGQVRDPSGAVVPGAAVAVKNDDTGLSRATTANHEGLWQLTFLPVGSYTASASASGFGKSTRNAQVQLNTSLRLDFELTPASLATEVTVTDEQPLLETARGEIKFNIDQKTIEDRPLSSRNILSLIEM